MFFGGGFGVWGAAREATRARPGIAAARVYCRIGECSCSVYLVVVQPAHMTDTPTGREMATTACCRILLSPSTPHQSSPRRGRLRPSLLSQHISCWVPQFNGGRRRRAWSSTPSPPRSPPSREPHGTLQVIWIIRRGKEKETRVSPSMAGRFQIFTHVTREAEWSASACYSRPSARYSQV